jgi:hypothetical protein
MAVVMCNTLGLASCRLVSASAPSVPDGPAGGIERSPVWWTCLVHRDDCHTSECGVACSRAKSALRYNLRGNSDVYYVSRAVWGVVTVHRSGDVSVCNNILHVCS